MKSTTVIRAENLRCSYGSFEAVRGIDLEVHRGELFALLGTNGAGKTTAMETLEGHRAADGGLVELLGKNPVRHRRTLRPRVGMMLQESGFAGDLTVAETLRMWARLRRGPCDVEQSIEAVALGHRADVRVRSLSGGERRRLDFAMAILGDPEVLFLDEPTTGMDPESRSRLWELIRCRVDEGVTVFLTTHYLEEAEELAARIAIMHEGRLAVVGSKAEVLTAQPAVIRFNVPAGEFPVDRTAQLGAEVDRRDGIDVVSIRTPALQRDLGELLDWAGMRRLELHDLVAKHASLDDIFAAVVRGENVGAQRVGSREGSLC